VTASTDQVPATAPVPSPAEHTHPCVRCGAPVPLDVGLCERCNPLGLKDASASQVHGTVIVAVIVAIIGLALIGRLALAGVGPFPATLVSSVTDGAGLAVTISVTNQGTGAGQTTCRLTDPLDRNGGRSGFILSPRIEPGQTVTFTKHVTEFGSQGRALDVACNAP
jgi:predicted nucleic acid-binding Zn ribbon protein